MINDNVLRSRANGMLEHKKSLLLIFYIFPILCFSQSLQPKEVLFIGNSLTFYHEMPAMLQQMLRENGYAINLHQSTQPGFTLSQHLTSESTLKKLNSQSWDIVVLQEGTIWTLIPEVVQYQVKPALVKLDSIIKAKGGRTVLYQSYSLSMYPARYCCPSNLIGSTLKEKEYCSAKLMNSKQEFEIIQNSFHELNNLIGSETALVGTSFELCKKKFPELMLFESREDPHPSKLGSYLIACIFYRVLTGEKTGEINYTAGLELPDIRKIKKVVDLKRVKK
jgi:hypothetical protein